MESNETYPLALPQRTILAGQYIIEKTLGQGGFGITYRAVDHKTGQKVAVKEFFPDSMATRTARTMVSAFSGERGENFAYGKGCFLQEAETLAQFIGNENIVRVYNYFEENGTAYFVMEYIEGTSFDQYIKDRGGKVSYEEAEKILLPVMDALAGVHARGIVHRDVTPDNIYITKDGKVKLLDFGAARYSLGDKSRSLDVVLKHGFAPKEQYTRHGRQGAFTDVYTLGASFYFAVTGRRPPEAIDRIEEDKMIPPSSFVKIPQEKEKAILKAMSVQPAHRYQTMGEFRQALMGAPAVGRQVAGQPVQNAARASMPQQPVQQRFFTEPQPIHIPQKPVQGVMQQATPQPIHIPQRPMQGVMQQATPQPIHIPQRPMQGTMQQAAPQPIHIPQRPMQGVMQQATPQPIHIPQKPMQGVMQQTTPQPIHIPQKPMQGVMQQTATEKGHVKLKDAAKKSDRLFHWGKEEDAVYCEECGTKILQKGKKTKDKLCYQCSQKRKIGWYL